MQSVKNNVKFGSKLGRGTFSVISEGTAPDKIGASNSGFRKCRLAGEPCSANGEGRLLKSTTGTEFGILGRLLKLITGMGGGKDGTELAGSLLV